VCFECGGAVRAENPEVLKSIVVADAVRMVDDE